MSVLPEVHVERLARIVATLLLVVLPVLFSLLLTAGPADAAAQDRDGFVPGEVLVKFRTGASAASRRASVARRGQAVISDL